MLTILSSVGLILYGLLGIMFLWIALSERDFTPYAVLLISFLFIGAIESACVIWWRKALWTLIPVFLGIVVAAVFSFVVVDDSIKRKDFGESFYFRLALGLMLLTISTWSLLTRN